jgi:hypothetical protein
MVINANGFTHLSCSQWEDTSFDGTYHKRLVNVVLGNNLSLDVTYGNAQGQCGEIYG